MASKLLKDFSANYQSHKEQEFTLEEYLNLCKKDPLAYATSAERMLAAIGDPEHIDTSEDPRLSRIFLNRTLRV